MTKVKFYMEGKDTVFAYFPELVFDNNGNKTSYSHIGQHSACSKEYIKGKKMATPYQYNSLLVELVAQGYTDLKIMNNQKDNIEDVKAKLYELFESFYQYRIKGDKFVAELKKICAGQGKKSYWWRFFKNDTLANDWQSVSNSLESTKNTAYLNECIEIALKDKEIIVFYS